MPVRASFTCVRSACIDLFAWASDQYSRKNICLIRFRSRKAVKSKIKGPLSGPPYFTTNRYLR